MAEVAKQTTAQHLAWFCVKYRKRVPEHDQQEKARSKTTDVKLLVQQLGGNSLSNKKGMGDEALNTTSLSVLFLRQIKVQPEVGK